MESRLQNLAGRESMERERRQLCGAESFIQCSRAFFRSLALRVARLFRLFRSSATEALIIGARCDDVQGHSKHREAQSRVAGVSADGLEPRQWVVHVSHENLLPARRMRLFKLLRFRLFLFLRLVSRPAYYGYHIGDEVHLRSWLDIYRHVCGEA